MSNSWRDPATGTTYHNISDPTSSYQREGINGGAIPSNSGIIVPVPASSRGDNLGQSIGLTGNNPYTNPSMEDLYGSNFHSNYITGNALWTDPRVNSAQRSMIQSNYYAQQAGNASPYSQDQIKGAAGGGYAGYSYAPGNMGDRYSYVQPYQTGGQNWISPTHQDGNTVVYRGYANEPELGRYARGVSSPYDMDYSWERTGGYDDLRAGTFQFNPEGAAAAAARDITTRLPSPAVTTLPDYALNPSQQNKGSYLDSPDWVGNVFPGAQWNDTSRTISVPGGGVLQEGVDFVIGQDNRAYVLPSINANITPNLTPALTTTPTTATAPTGVPNTGNEWHNLWKDMQNQYAEAMPAFNPPAREDFRFLTPPQSISSSGDDVHTPTLAARQQWENEQNAIQDQYSKQYGVNYQRAQDIYNTQLDWLKTGMLEQQRQEQVAAEAARYQAETALKLEQEKYNRAVDMWQSGVGTDEIYRTLGIPAGAKPIEQTMSEWKMDLAEKEYALSASKAAKSGGGGGSRGTGGSGGGTVYVPPNPFQDTGGGEKGATIRGYKVTRLDEYISTQRARLKTPEAVAEYVKNTKLLNSDFKQAVLTRLNHHLAS